jgi:hypothetical protein
MLLFLGFPPDQFPHRGEEFRSVDSEQIQQYGDVLWCEAAIRKTLANLRSVGEVLGPINFTRVRLDDAFPILRVDQERHLTRIADLYVAKVGDDQRSRNH